VRRQYRVFCHFSVKVCSWYKIHSNTGWPAGFQYVRKIPIFLSFLFEDAQEKIERIVCSTNFSLCILTDTKHVLKFAQNFITMKSNSTSVLVITGINKTLLIFWNQYCCRCPVCSKPSEFRYTGQKTRWQNTCPKSGSNHYQVCHSFFFSFFLSLSCLRKNS